MCLGIPKITPQIIRALVKMGFKAIRIPVAWLNHLVYQKYPVIVKDIIHKKKFSRIGKIYI